MPRATRSSSSSNRCARSSSQTRSSRISRTRSSSAFAALLLSLFAAELAAAELKPSPSRDRRVEQRWSLSGAPRGMAVDGNGTLYVGLSEPQAIVAIDPKRGAIVREVVLDSPDIASTKEFASVRIDAAGTRLLIAQGSDESVSILTLPELKIEREIGLEGESIRDAIFDPKGRHIYVLGRTVHVFDSAGQREIRTLSDLAPMAIATDSQGLWLAVAGSEEFENGPATMVSIYDAETLKEIAREPLQTERRIEAMLFASDDTTLVVLARDWFAEKPLKARKPPELTTTTGSSMRMNFRFGDFVNSERICLPDASGPQIGAIAGDGRTLLFAEKRCSASGGLTASPRNVATASLYAVNAFAIAYDAVNDVVYATEPAGYLTRYKTPRPERPAGAR